MAQTHANRTMPRTPRGQAGTSGDSTLLPHRLTTVNDIGAARPQPSNVQSWVEINTNNVVANALALLEHAPNAGLLAVLKANAYGLGAIEIARCLRPVPLWGIAVTNLDEAAILRESGASDRILVLRPPSAALCAEYSHYALRPVVEDIEFLKHWGGPFHVEVDTGMSRTGIPWNQSCQLKALFAHRPEGVFTHLHSADCNHTSVELQRERFERAQRHLGPELPLRHVANSAGVFALDDHYELIRPGLFLFGGKPSPSSPEPAEVVSVKSRIVSVRQLRRGETVSYGGEWRAAHDCAIATLPIGYADGIPRSLRHGSHVLVRGRRCPIVGRITMDMLMIDVSSLPLPQVGEGATLIGSDGSAAITLELFARWAGLLPYEILIGLGNRLPRVYSPGTIDHAVTGVGLAV